MAVSDGFPRRLAWSNTGSIAQISKDGSKASFRTMIRNQKTGVYKLSDRSKHAVELPEGRHFVHLQFNGLGLELAVIDNHGGIHLCSVAGATGRMQQAAADPTIRDGGRNDLDAVVAMLWLPLYPSEFRVSRQNEPPDGLLLTAREVAIYYSSDQE